MNTFPFFHGSDTEVWDAFTYELLKSSLYTIPEAEIIKRAAWHPIMQGNTWVSGNYRYVLLDFLKDRWNYDELTKCHVPEPWVHVRDDLLYFIFHGFLIIYSLFFKERYSRIMKKYGISFIETHGIPHASYILDDRYCFVHVKKMGEVEI
jgi:hypothetical protein